MNIFEELAESYTYNGAVSLKALDDDIVTLENQIDSYNATLRELQIRGKKVAPLVEKIRDTKIRLSLLKAFYKKESDKATSDDVILDMLGVSAKNAKEIDTVSTAADGRTPKSQNFESAELEKVEEPKEEIILNEDTPSEEALKKFEEIKKEREEAETRVQVLEDNNSNEETVVINESASEESKEPEPLVKTEEEKNTDTTNVNTEAIPTEKGLESVSVEKDTKEQETKSVKAEKKSLVNFFKKIVSKESGSTEVSDITLPKSSVNFLRPSNEDTDIIPPPTIDDYAEVESGPLYEVTYDDDGAVYKYSNDQELPETEAVLKETEEECREPRAYDAFQDFNNKIYASFDLFDYTDMANTNSITGCFNDKDKTLDLTFTDMIDYPLLSFFLNEKHKKESLFDRFAKKQKNIIMYVRTEINGVEKEYRYEFIGCRLAEVFDSEYKSMRDSTYYPTATHEFYAKFKYKRLKIS